MTILSILGNLVDVIQKLFGMVMPGLQQRSNSQSDHDKIVFAKLDAIMSEQKFDSILNGLYAQMFFESQSSIMDNFVIEMSSISYSFIDKAIDEKTKDLIDKLRKLQDFRRNYFDWHHNNKPEDADHRIVFNLKMKDNEEEYRKLSDKLNKLIEDAQESYIEYRKSVKNRLFV